MWSELAECFQFLFISLFVFHTRKCTSHTGNMHVQRPIKKGTWSSRTKILVLISKLMPPNSTASLCRESVKLLFLYALYPVNLIRVTLILFSVSWFFVSYLFCKHKAAERKLDHEMRIWAGCGLQSWVLGINCTLHLRSETGMFLHTKNSLAFFVVGYPQSLQGFCLKISWGEL